MKSLPAYTFLIMALLTAMLIPACGDSEQTPPATNSDGASATTPEPKEDVVIRIGNLTDMTGTGSNAISVIDMALNDLVDYYNEQNLIPGVKLKVIAYDTAYDPSRDIPGYKWLKERGADLIYTSVTSAPVTLRPLVEEDQMCLFAASAPQEQLIPPGHVFMLGEINEEPIYTLLKWIAENDWDYVSNGPARIGGACWQEPAAEAYFEAMKNYAEAHPDQFEWVGGYLTTMGTFTWGPEVEELKDCDYVFPPTVLVSFVKEYRTAGYEADFIGVDTHIAFLGLIRDAKLLDELDGMLIARMLRWWNEDGEIIDLTEQLLKENHPGEAEKIMSQGVGYLVMANFVIMLEMIQDAVETVGPENFDSEALYQEAQSYTRIVDGVERWSYSETKRSPADLYGIYRISAAEGDVIRVSQEWYPTVRKP
ncbi:MAG: ABC transporter substrate-binding protein [Dehalococcoidia bacterium]